MQVIPDPGIPNIKRVELFTKYLLLIPLQFQDITCPHPGDKALAKIKIEQNTRVRKRQKQKMETKKEKKKDTMKSLACAAR